MSKGYLYDNGDEIITRESGSIVPAGSSDDIGKTVVIGEDGDAVLSEKADLVLDLVPVKSASGITYKIREVGKASDTYNIAISDIYDYAQSHNLILHNTVTNERVYPQLGYDSDTEKYSIKIGEWLTTYVDGTTVILLIASSVAIGTLAANAKTFAATVVPVTLAS